MKERKLCSEKSRRTIEKSERVENESDGEGGGNPFNLEWVFGFNPIVPMINLSTSAASKAFAVASAHVVQIYRHDGNEMQSFVGHESEIVELTGDATGRFLASADARGIINIWDISIAREFPHPIRSIYDPCGPERALAKVAMSCDGKSIVATSEGKGSFVKLWQWSLSTEKENSKDSFRLSEKFEDVQSVRFSCNEIDSQMFVVTSKNGVSFAEWNRKQQHLRSHFPARAISISFEFIDTIFIENSRQAMSITRCGSVVIWSDVLTSSEENRAESFAGSSLRKEFIKSIKLSESPLRVIRSVDGFVILSDERGHIRFYDQELKILFWCPSHDAIDSIVTMSFDLTSKVTEDEASSLKVRDFFVQTQSDIFSVDVSQMKFTKTFYKSDDFITAIDVFPCKGSLVCCASNSGRIFLYDYETKALVVENRLKLQKRKGSTSDTDIVQLPCVASLAFSPDGHHLLCGLRTGVLVALDPNVLVELKRFSLSQNPIAGIKFSPDASFVAVYDEKANVALLNRDKALSHEDWTVLGKVRYHTKAICDVLFIPPSASQVSSHHKTLPRLISLAQDRQIVEYDLVESLKPSRGLAITFAKRIFQTSLPVAVTLIHSSKRNEEQLLVADTKMKFKLFDKSTFEILATFLGPIYDSNVKQFDAFTLSSSTRSKFLAFSTDRHICLYALPVDGNPFRSLGIVGHCKGVKSMRTDASRKFLFSVGNDCQSLFMWSVDSRPLFEHLDEGGDGLKPYCDLLPGGKFGSLFQQMQNLFFYMLLMSNNNSIDHQTVREGLDEHEVHDFMRGMGFFPSDYEIECLHHELALNGKRKVVFEELVKLFINHSHSPPNGTQKASFESALRSILNIPEGDSTATVSKSQLLSILTGEGEKIAEKDAERYLKEVFGKANEVSLENLTMQVSRISRSPSCFT